VARWSDQFVPVGDGCQYLFVRTRRDAVGQGAHEPDGSYPSVIRCSFGWQTGGDATQPAPIPKQYDAGDRPIGAMSRRKFARPTEQYRDNTTAPP
jgi:hypothetical protein